MSLVFDYEDEDGYFEARDVLLEELYKWAKKRTDTDAAMVDGSAVFLDWRFSYSTGELDRFTPDEVAEFLLDWCPRKVAMPKADWPLLVEGPKLWIHFLHATDRWAGGLVRPTLDAFTRLRGDFNTAMSDSSKHGMAKSFLGSDLGSGPFDDDAFGEEPFAIGPFDDDFLDGATSQEILDAFEMLPADQQAELLALGEGGLIGDFFPDPRPVPITPDPDLALAETQANEAPFITQLRALVERNPRGWPLDEEGHLLPDDAKALIGVFSTDDSMDAAANSSDNWNAPHLQYLMDAVLYATEEVNDPIDDFDRLVIPAEWLTDDPVAAVDSLFAAMLDIGPLDGRISDDQVDLVMFLEDGLAHWLADAFVDGETSVDDIVTHALETITSTPQQFDLDSSHEDTSTRIADGIEMALDAPLRCGLISRIGHRRSDEPHANTKSRGGIIKITELGRTILADVLRLEGYLIRTHAEIAALPVDELMEHLAMLGDLTDAALVWRIWHPERSESTRAEEVFEALKNAEHPNQRLAAMYLLQGVPTPATVEPLARDLLKTPFGGHCMEILIATGLEEESRRADMEPKYLLGPTVDLFAAVILAGEFHAFLTPPALADDTLLAFLGNLWRVQLPETADVLEAIGRDHPTKKVAKAARKALFRHRSMFADL